MLRLARRLSLAAFTLVPAVASGGPATCPGLVGPRRPNLTVTVAEAATSGSVTPPGEKPLTGLRDGGHRHRPPEQHDLSTALEKRVEEGVAPGTMIAVRPADGRTPAGTTPMTRPLRPYPTSAVYRRAGSPDDPSSYLCEAR